MPRTPTRTEALYGDLVSQYLALQEEHPGVVLLFRVGSFYEVLFEDAEVVARELGLKLSDRPSGGSAPTVPQCGFAHHALDSFLARLLAKGYRVAVVEETEDDDVQGVRHRTVVRTLTPGTVTDPGLLADDRPTYLVAIVADGEHFGLAWTDVAAGEFKAGEFDAEAAAAELQRLAPAEVLLPVDTQLPHTLLGSGMLTRVESAPGAGEILRATFPESALADLPLAELAAGLVIRYLETTAASGHLPRVDAPMLSDNKTTLQMDAATQRHLEIVETERSRDRVGSLLHVVDRCATPMGRRMLRNWLLRPLRDIGKISVRQQIVSELVADEELLQSLVQLLDRTPDLERLAGRAASRNASTEDLHALAGLHGLVTPAHDNVSRARTGFLRSLGRKRSMLAEFATEAAGVLAEPESPHTIRRGASSTLDHALARVEDAEAWQSRYVEELRQQPNLGKVKIARNSTQGLFVEVAVNTVVPVEWTRRGGLQKVERYTTFELEQHAAALAEAEAVVGSETLVLLSELRDMAVACAGETRDLGRHLAAVDALCSFATVAVARGWVCPTVDATTELEIRAGRHPVLEESEAFQANDTHLVGRGEVDQVVVLTGPNMAGKSTWMRQIALLVILAQAGSFVPASEARVGMADAIFTRIGAVDDLARGRSTFMVEMLETATVFRGATDLSLVLLDEIGRGTSTHDGMAIAWAVIEHLANGPNRPRAILSTHYHELAALRKRCRHITLLQAVVAETPSGLVFSHRIEPGAADRSFGIEVARLAGLPDEVVCRARQVAEAIEPLTRDLVGRLDAPLFS